MGRRRTIVVLGTAVVSGVASLTLAPGLAPAQAATRHSTRHSTHSGSHLTRSADAALGRLRASASRPVRIRSQRGTVAFVASRDGRALLAAPAGASARTAAERQLARFGGAFGLDGRRSRAVVTRTLTSATGGQVVRATQVVDGVPVFGGQVVTSLDRHQGVVSVAAATTPSTDVPAPVVSEAAARRTALTTASRAHRIAASRLHVTSLGRRLYDPAIVHSADVSGARPVWLFRLSNGTDVRESVLVETGTGRVALHYNDAPEALNRSVCDNRNIAHYYPWATVPACLHPVRREGGPASRISDANRAYLNLGVAASAYQRLDGIDLTDLVGASVSGRKTLMSTVRWCFKLDGCPMSNAFWDGRQMVFGQGFAGADDVVAHELTHGYIERTSALFPFNQSGAMNESLADTIGEIADHLHAGATDNDTAWILGEDLHVSGARRSMKDPTHYGQPDRMTSALYGGDEASEDNGDVHLNDGVGNKTAYLISQGGTFNGHTITGIDAGDATLAKTGMLYLETIKRLTSGSEYADLGATLASTCDTLAAGSTGGFTTADCDQVREAALATELAKRPRDPGASAAEATSQCPTGYTTAVRVGADDDATHTLPSSFGALWSRTPDKSFAKFGATPKWAASGTSSWFGWDPDPEGGSGRSSSAVLGPFTVPSSGGSLLWFRHAYLLEGYPAEDGFTADWYDGGTVTVQTRNTDGSWSTQGSLPWVNGPNKTIEGTHLRGFSGDSHGYGSSAVDLTSLAGQDVRVLFGVVGDSSDSFVGWWVDDIRLNNCTGAAPDAPTGVTATISGRTAQVSWTPSPSAGVSGYRIRRTDDANPVEVPGQNTVTLTGFTGTSNVGISVLALAADGSPSPAAYAPGLSAAYPSIATSTDRAYRGHYIKVSTIVVRRGTHTRLGRVGVHLQRHVAGSSGWTTIASGTASSTGYKLWYTRVFRLSAYRVVVDSQPAVFGSASRTAYVYVR